MPKSTPTRQRHPPKERPQGDAWVDDVTDEVQALLSEHGLELEMVAFYDPLTHVFPYCSSDALPGTVLSRLDSIDSASPFTLPGGC